MDVEPDPGARDAPPPLPPLPLPPVPSSVPGPAHGYGPPTPPTRARPPGRAAMVVGWVLLALSIPANVVLGALSGYAGLWSLMEPGVLTVLLFSVPVALLAATIVLLVRLVRRRPSLVLGGALLAVGVVGYVWARSQGL